MPTIKNHLKELKNRALWVVIPGIILLIFFFIISPTIINFLLNAFNIKATLLTPLEYINTQIKLSLELTILCLIPLFFFQLYKYVEEVLPKQTRVSILNYVLSSICLMEIGFIFAVMVFIPQSFQFFKDVPSNITLMWGLESTINFITFSIMAFALIFQITLLIPSLDKLGLINTKALKRYRLIILAVIFLVAGFITPGVDLYSQSTMAIPTYASFEIGLFFCKFNKDNGGE